MSSGVFLQSCYGLLPVLTIYLLTDRYAIVVEDLMTSDNCTSTCSLTFCIYHPKKELHFCQQFAKTRTVSLLC
ncbi:hypothetical protein GQ55_3G098200 [Panicum hallii var. hallii]|uniref:Uncharacterized protein n=1 Tax=Panicum hallii var. hallii TaxID=1504633 RepID=A0A2T7E7N2_9POAL|nr:hypothetical protein GQ55_3G098200 [Panicum hallii var. hallii]